jgi:hypothetical protein
MSALLGTAESYRIDSSEATSYPLVVDVRSGGQQQGLRRPSHRCRAAPRTGINVSKKRVERLMRKAGIFGLLRSRRRGTTTRVPDVRVADDLVQLRFRPGRPTSCGSRTSPISRPGRAAAASLQSSTSTRARSSAGNWPSTFAPSSSSTRCRWLSTVADPTIGLVHHSGWCTTSDSGSQYTSIDYTQTLEGSRRARVGRLARRLFRLRRRRSFFSTLGSASARAGCSRDTLECARDR